MKQRDFLSRALNRGVKKPSLSPCLNAVVRLLVHNGDVLPAELEDDLGHGEGLVVVAGDGAGEVLEALLVRQFGTRREEGDLEGAYRKSNASSRDQNFSAFHKVGQQVTFAFPIILHQGSKHWTW